MQKISLTSLVAACAMAGAIGAAVALAPRVLAHDDDDHAKPSPVGAWFGVARPCTPQSGAPHPTVNQEVCEVACGGHSCAPPTLPDPEVTMMPALFADGTVVATDFGSVGVSPPGFPIAGDGHSSALGNWALVGPTRIGGKRYDRYQSAFLWFQGRLPGEPYNPASPTGFFRGSMRPRFVTFFSASTPDIMQGFIQPYGYAYTDANGTVELQPGTPFPDPDPVAPLPSTCDPTNFTARPYCFGTFQFTIRRVPAQ